MTVALWRPALSCSGNVVGGGNTSGGFAVMALNTLMGSASSNGVAAAATASGSADEPSSSASRNLASGKAKLPSFLSRMRAVSKDVGNAITTSLTTLSNAGPGDEARGSGGRSSPRSRAVAAVTGQRQSTGPSSRMPLRLLQTTGRLIRRHSVDAGVWRPHSSTGLQPGERHDELMGELQVIQPTTLLLPQHAQRAQRVVSAGNDGPYADDLFMSDDTLLLRGAHPSAPAALAATSAPLRAGQGQQAGAARPLDAAARTELDMATTSSTSCFVQTLADMPEAPPRGDAALASHSSAASQLTLLQKRLSGPQSPLLWRPPGATAPTAPAAAAAATAAAAPPRGERSSAEIQAQLAQLQAELANLRGRMAQQRNGPGGGAEPQRAAASTPAAARSAAGRQAPPKPAAAAAGKLTGGGAKAAAAIRSFDVRISHEDLERQTPPDAASAAAATAAAVVLPSPSISPPPRVVSGTHTPPRASVANSSDSSDASAAALHAAPSRPAPLAMPPSPFDPFHAQQAAPPRQPGSDAPGDARASQGGHDPCTPASPAPSPVALPPGSQGNAGAPLRSEPSRLSLATGGHQAPKADQLSGAARPLSIGSLFSPSGRGTPFDLKHAPPSPGKEVRRRHGGRRGRARAPTPWVCTSGREGRAGRSVGLRAPMLRFCCAGACAGGRRGGRAQPRGGAPVHRQRHLGRGARRYSECGRALRQVCLGEPWPTQGTGAAVWRVKE